MTDKKIVLDGNNRLVAENPDTGETEPVEFDQAAIASEFTDPGGELHTEALADRSELIDFDVVERQSANEVVDVGPESQFASINEALLYLTNKRLNYTQGGFEAVINLQPNFVMTEQVLVDGLNLNWITISAEVGTDVGGVDALEEGQLIDGFGRSEISDLTIDAYDINSYYDESNSRFLDGEYVALSGGSTGGDGAYYFWFNVTDATTLSFVDSNAGDPNPDFGLTTAAVGVQVDILLEDTASVVADKLQSAINGQTEFTAGVIGETIEVFNDDAGSVRLLPSSEIPDGDFETTIIQNGSDGYATDLDVGTYDNKAYTINGAANPQIDVVRGESYVINVNAPGQNFYVQTAEAPYDSSAIYPDGFNNLGEDTGTITWTVPTDAPNTLYYVSEGNSSYSGTITVHDGLGGFDGSSTAQEISATFTDYVVEPVEEVYTESSRLLNGNYFEFEVQGLTNPQYIWYNVNGEGTDPALVNADGHEVTLGVEDTADVAASQTQIAADAIVGVTATVNGRTTQLNNDTVGEVPPLTPTGAMLTATQIQQGRGDGYYTNVTIPAHGLANGDRIQIIDHNSGEEEVNYNGIWSITNVTTDTFDLDYVANPDALYDAGRSLQPTTASVLIPGQIPVSRASLTETWEFFYQPAFGVARGILPTIDCVFSMDESGDNPYFSYKDGLCATDKGHINVTPFSGFVNAGGSNIYATRSSIINANDAVANGAGRMGVWAYSNSLINARRVEAKDCGYAGSGSDTGNGFDSAGRPIGNGVNATRGSLVNAAGVVTGGCQGDNVYASYGGQINLEGHATTPTFLSASVNGQDINIDGGTVTEADGTRFDQIKDTTGSTMLQGNVASGSVTLSDGLAEFSTNINDTDATFMLALGIDDPNADVEVAGSLFWDDSAGNYEIRIRETDTWVGNPTVNYDVLRVR